MGAVMIDWDEDDFFTLRQERRYRQILARHPDCRDPDHPGCECCGEAKDEEQQGEG